MPTPNSPIPILAELRDQFSSEADVADALDAAITHSHAFPVLMDALQSIRVYLSVGMVSDTLDLSRLCRDLARVAGAAIRKAQVAS